MTNTTSDTDMNTDTEVYTNTTHFITIQYITSQYPRGPPGGTLQGDLLGGPPGGPLRGNPIAGARGPLQEGARGSKAHVRFWSPETHRP